MSQRFVVATQRLTAEQQDRVTAFVRGKGWQVWHWLPDIWLLAEVPSTYSAKSVSEAFDSLIEASERVVFSIDGPSEYFGKSSTDSWAWMGKYWGKVSTDPKDY